MLNKLFELPYTKNTIGNLSIIEKETIETLSKNQRKEIISELYDTSKVAIKEPQFVIFNYREFNICLIAKNTTNISKIINTMEEIRTYFDVMVIKDFQSIEHTINKIKEM